MSPDEIKQYIHDKNFQRNESIWILKTIDHKSSQEIATIFNISVDAVDLIVKKHQEYWDEPK
jgi:DNA-directed RNA polymerase specialized sigma24 family protein